MPSRGWRFRIDDILEAVAAVRGYTAGMGLDQFIRDRRTVDAVVRNLMIIGEAAVHVPEEVCQKPRTSRGWICAPCGISSSTSTSASVKGSSGTPSKWIYPPSSSHYNVCSHQEAAEACQTQRPLLVWFLAVRPRLPAFPTMRESCAQKNRSDCGGQCGYAMNPRSPGSRKGTPGS